MIPPDWLPGLPVAVPLLVAAVLVGGAPVLRAWLADTMAIAAAAVVTVICAALFALASQGPIVYWFGGWQPRQGIAVGISFTIDWTSAGLATLVSVLVTFALLYAASYFRNIGTLFHGLMLVFLAAMVGFCLTGDLFNMFVFFELMSVSAYALTGYKIEERGPIQGALNFAISNSLGAFLFLFGIGLLYGRTGALNLAQIGRQISLRSPDDLIYVALALIAIGLCVKAAVFPFHFWLPDAHAVAPTPVCILFSGVMVELGLYGLLRIYWTVFSGVTAAHADNLRLLLVVAGMVTALLGGMMCYLQRHIKRMLAYSTVSHAGAFLVGAASLSATGLSGTMLYVVGHGLVKGALFMVAGILLDRFGSVDEIDLAGRGRPLRAAAVVFGLGGLALAGAPFFVSTTGKTLVEDGFHGPTAMVVAVVLVVSSVLTGAAVLRTTLRVFCGYGHDARDLASRAPTHGDEGREGREDGPHGTPWGMLVPSLTLMAAALGLAVFDTPLGQVEIAARQFMDQQMYASVVLDGQPAALSAPVANARPTTTGLVLGVVSTVGALGLAGIALKLVRLPVTLASGSAALGQKLVSPLRRMHSGHVGDYTAWLLMGTVVFGGAYLAALR